MNLVLARAVKAKPVKRGAKKRISQEGFMERKIFLALLLTAPLFSQARKTRIRIDRFDAGGRKR